MNKNRILVCDREMTDKETREWGRQHPFYSSFCYYVLFWLCCKNNKAMSNAVHANHDCFEFAPMFRENWYEERKKRSHQAEALNYTRRYTHSRLLCIAIRYFRGKYEHFVQFVVVIACICCAFELFSITLCLVVFHLDVFFFVPVILLFSLCVRVGAGIGTNV